MTHRYLHPLGYFLFVSIVTLLLTHRSVVAQPLGFFRFESDPGFEANSAANSSLTEYGSVEPITLTNEGPGAHFPTGLLGIGANRSAASTDSSIAGLIGEDTLTVDDAFTVELFANFDNLARTRSRSVMVAQAEFPCCGDSATGFSWAFTVEREGASNFPGAPSSPRELEVFVSDGSAIWLLPSGIFLEENTDYYLSASFDLDADLRFYVKDLSTNETQTVEMAHPLDQLNPHSTLGVTWPEHWSLFEGILDEVRFTRGVLSEDELLINRFAEPGDFNVNGVHDVNDINQLLPNIAGAPYDRVFDVNRDGAVNFADLNAWVGELKGTWIGDANLDGEFNSGDLVQVFQAGHYEDGIAMNSGWAEGDWNGDGDFDTGDLVFAFQDGGYELGGRVSLVVPEPSMHFLPVTLAGLIVIRGRRLRRWNNHRRTSC